MQPIIYNSLDANAPQLTIAAGTLKTVLKACLVTGYGSKPAAGWEIAWADDVANKIALRSKNQTSIKSVLLIDDNAAASATVTAYTGWDSATNVGIGQFATGYFVKRWNTGFTPSWIVIATDKFFYLFVQIPNGDTTTKNMNGFGDCYSARNDKSYSVLLANRTTNYSNTEIGYTSIKNQEGNDTIFPLTLFPKYNNNNNFGDRAAADISATAKSNYVSSTAILSKFALYTTVDGYIQPVVLLPGMLMPHCQVAGHSNHSIPGIVFIDNQYPYKNNILGIYQAFCGRVWIHTDDWGQ